MTKWIMPLACVFILSACNSMSPRPGNDARYGTTGNGTTSSSPGATNPNGEMPAAGTGGTSGSGPSSDVAPASSSTAPDSGSSSGATGTSTPTGY